MASMATVSDELTTERIEWGGTDRSEVRIESINRQDPQWRIHRQCRRPRSSPFRSLARNRAV
jgi:hypothetical protein